MTNPVSSQEKENLKFFGRVNASISHELKNILAIMSETMGFVDDLVELAHHGKPLDLSILEKSSTSIAEEIERGFDTIRQMNKFAHSVDDLESGSDLLKSLELAANLTRFLSTSKPVKIEDTAGEARLSVGSYFMVCFLYAALCDLLASKDVSEIVVRIEDLEDDRVQVAFSGLDGKEMRGGFSDQTRAQGSRLGIETDWDEKRGELKMVIK